MNTYTSKEKKFISYYSRKKSDFDRLGALLSDITQRALTSAGVLHIPPVTRVKTEESCIGKIKIKNYADPISEITDILGLRIIAYLESDIEKAENAIRTVFDVNDQLSVNKRIARNVNEVGYRSLHLICSLGERRRNLPEYENIYDLNFEVQIRTALEHTWAEIEHKKNYKSNSKTSLPQELQRRLMILAGTLELVDHELSGIAKDADDYSERVSLRESDTLDDNISVLSLSELLKNIKRDGYKQLQRIDVDNLDIAIGELSKFGIENNRDLENLLTDHVKNTDQIHHGNTEIGFIRDAMIRSDLEKYFEAAYDRSYGILLSDLPELMRMLNEESVDTTADRLRSLGVEVIDAYDSDPDVVV